VPVAKIAEEPKPVVVPRAPVSAGPPPEATVTVIRGTQIANIKAKS
jgi:hypothetical protein